MSARIRLISIMVVLGVLVGATIQLYCYLQEQRHLPDFLCIAPRETARSEEGVVSGSVAGTLNWIISPAGDRLEKEAIIELKNENGLPIAGATIEVGFDMPSMPMAHAIPNVVAEPAGQDGRYKVRFKVDMAGVWVAKINVKQPVTIRTVRPFQVD